MTLEQRARRDVCLLVTVCLLTSLVASAAIAMHFTGAADGPAATAPHATAPSEASLRTEGSFIDHSVVRHLEQEPPQDTPGMSVGAYGA